MTTTTSTMTDDDLYFTPKIPRANVEACALGAGISRARGYELLKRAWTQIKADVDETGIDRQELLAWSIQTLMAAAGQA